MRPPHWFSPRKTITRPASAGSRPRLRYSLLLFLSLFLLRAQAQNIALSNSVTNIITQSTPQAYQFQKYGDMPVNTNTGTATVQVPLFKIAIKNVDWDISLSYHTQGIRVSEVAGCVGLGWNLQAPGMISSRSLQQSDVFVDNEGDLPANRKTFVLGATSADPQLGSCSYLNIQDAGFVTNMMAARENQDSRNIQNFMPDIFYLSAGSLNAKFFLKDHLGYCMPSQDITIQHFSTPSHYWIIKDGQGSRYTFELSGGNASEFYWPNNVDLEGPGGNPAAYGNYNPVFVLKKIENLFGEKIEFYYTKEFYKYQGNEREVYVDLPNEYPSTLYCNSPGGSGFQPLQHKKVFHEACDSRLDSIVSTTGDKIVFSYSSRSDLAGASKLNTVTRYYRTAATQSFIASFRLHNSYFGTGTLARELRLKLDSVLQVDAAGQTLKNYSFTYNATGLPSRLSKAQDTFGFYNGKLDNYSLVPVMGNDRSTSLVHAKACILEKVSYPTGGYTLFNYEAKSSGGLRIRSVQDYNMDGTLAQIKEYEYSQAWASMGGDFSKDIQFYTMACIAQGFPKHQITCSKKETYSEPVIDVYNSFYGDATERYGTVTEYHGPGGVGGKIEYRYGMQDLAPRMGMPIMADLLSMKTVFKKTATGYLPVSKEIKRYKNINETENSTTFFLDAVNPREVRTFGLDFEVARPEMFSNASECNGPITVAHCYPYRYWQQSFRLVSTPVMLKEEETVTYGQTSNDSLKRIIVYSYLPNTILSPVAVEEQHSDGAVSKKTTLYPLQLAGITATDPISAGIKNLRDQHVINVPVEQSEYLKPNPAGSYKLLNTTFTTYKATLPLPDKITTVETTVPLTDFIPAAVTAGAIARDSRYVDRVLFNAYDSKGNILHQQKVNDLSYTYIWDYQQHYPVAEVKCADPSRVAYTSFEADGFGGWTINPGSVILIANNELTGKKILSGVVYKTVPTGNYTVGVWSYANTWVNGQSLVQSPTKIVGVWRYFEVKLNNVSYVEVAGDNIDEVRLYPQGAEMTTYTYHPLIGLSGSCNSNNQISYYEYDSFNRLLRMRDENRNILKQYDYRVQVPANPNAQWTATGNTRCKTCAANSNYFTDTLQREERDLGPQSYSYNQLRWIDVGPGGGCVATADWQYTATALRCQKISGQNNGYQEREQRDLNPCSPTYNQARWVTQTQNCSVCPKPASWQPTGNFRCVKDGSNNNTGEREREERDTDACSLTYNQLRWVSVGLNGTACPPPGCNYSVCNQQNQKCINDNCETGVKIYTTSYYNASTGMYECSYHYVFSDYSTSQNYVEYNPDPCPIF